MPTNCSVSGCRNNEYNTKFKKPMVSYYSFPSQKYEVERKKIWTQFVKRKNSDGTSWTPTKHSRICSDHFIDNSKTNDPRSPSYNPTIHPLRPHQSKTNEDKQSRYQRVIGRERKKRDEMVTLPSPAKKPRLDSAKKKSGEEIPGSSQKCSNCDVMFSSKIRKNISIPVGGDNQKDPVSIKKALAFVFESLGQSEDFELEDSEFLTETDSFYMCLNCAMGLSGLYKAFKSFAILGSVRSTVNLKLTKLRMLNQRGTVWDESVEYDEDFFKEEPLEDEDEFMEEDPLSFCSDENKFNPKCNAPAPRRLDAIEEEPDEDGNFIKEEPAEDEDEFMEEDPLSFGTDENKINPKYKVPAPSRLAPIEEERENELITSDRPNVPKSCYRNPKTVLPKSKNETNIEKKSNNSDSTLKEVEKQIHEIVKPAPKIQTEECSKNIKPKPGDNCSNCCVAFSEKIRKISAISVKGENERNFPVQIKRALTFVFESIGDKLDFPHLKRRVFLTEPPKDKLLFLCLNCALSLGQLYKTFKHFTDREIFESEIGKNLRLLRVSAADLDSENENQKAGGNCSNCEIIFNEKIRKISALSVTEKSEANTPVPIKDALGFVFESFGEKSDALWRKSVFSPASKIVPSLFLCIDCALSLGRLYKAFKHFTDLGIADCEISDTLKILRLIFKIELNKKLRMDDIRFTSNEMKYLHRCNKYLLESESSQNVAKTSDSNSGNNKNTRKKNISCKSPSQNSSDSECTTDDENYQKEKHELKRQKSLASSKVDPVKSLDTECHKCVLCDREFSRKSWLLSHILARHTRKNNLACSVCKKKFFHQDHLTLHMFRHNKNEKPPFHCKPCDQYFLRERQLSRHEFLKHQREQKCEMCDEVFYTLKSLNRHKRKCKSQKVNGTCQICKEEFQSAKDVLVHVGTHNGEEGPWKCPHCDSNFNFPINFHDHFLKTHSEVTKKLCCSICGMMLQSQTSLKNHEDLHAENIPRPFKCTVENCTLRFRTAQNLKVHAGRHAKKAEGKTFTCSENNCGKSFSTESGLKQHSSIHSDVNIIVCDFCGKTFNYRQNLRTHIKNMHSKKQTKQN